MEMIHKLNEKRHLECSRCSYRGSDYESVQIHMGTVHPEYCDEMDTAGLGKLVFYQKSAKLFHCYKCFFTSKMFSNVYYHITSRHALPDKLANDKNNVLSANMEQNGNTESGVNKPLVESSDDDKSMDDASERDEKQHIMLPLKPEEKDLLNSFPDNITPKEEESSDVDSNSCTFDKKDMNVLESKGKASNSDEEQLDFESSDNSSTYPAGNKAEASSAQAKHIPEFSDDEETPALPKEIMEFSDNEETPPLPKEIMEFSDGEDTPALPKEIMDFSDNEDSTLPKEMMEFSDNEEETPLPKGIMEFSDGEDTPAPSNAMDFSDNEESTTVAKDKTELSDEEEIPSQSKDAPESSDDEETPPLPNDVPEFSDEEETRTASKNIPEFSDEEETPALSKDLPESSDEETTARSKAMPDSSDDDSTTALSKDVPEFSDNENTSNQSKDIPDYSDNEDTSTRSKGMMDFSDTEDIPTLSKDLDFSDNEENSRPKETLVFSNLKENLVRPKSIMSFSDSEETPARPKGIMEFSDDDEEATAFSKDLPKFSEGSITPTTPTRSDDVPELSDNLKGTEQLKNMLGISHRDKTPTQINKTMSFADKTVSQSISKMDMQTPVRSKSIMEFSEDEDTPASVNNQLKSPEEMTPSESKDGESSEEKETLTQEETMLKYLRRGKGKYHCLMCECRPMRKGAVLHHLVAKHNIPSPYQCKDCGKNFVLENVYKNHLMSHTEGMFKCTRCSFETNHPRGFKKHQTHCQNRHSEGANKKLWDFQDNEREKEENSTDNAEEGSKDNTEENIEDI